MKALVAIAFAVAIVATVNAIAQAQRFGCDGAEARQFDFWVGEWDLAYVQGGKEGRSTNRITKVLDGCAILEEFDGVPGTPLQGRSYSTYDRATKAWKQTWVDNTGSYLDFSGGLEDGRMVLNREFVRNGKAVKQRMVWQDIEADRLKWLWQASQDGGSTWTTAWEIEYRRKR